VVNHIVDLGKNKRSSTFVLKVDFEKTYDFIDWSFLEYMLRRYIFVLSEKFGCMTVAY